MIARVALAGVALTLAAAACSSPPKPKPPPLVVDTAEIKRMTIGNYDELNGQVTPYLQSSLSTQQSGTIVREYANEGDRVTDGEILAQIDASPLVATLQEQRGAATQAVAKLSQSKIQQPITDQTYRSALSQAQQSLTQANQQQQTDVAALKNAALVFDSNKQLVSQGYVAQTSFESSRSQYVAAQKTLQIDSEKITQARAALAQAERNLLNSPLQSQVVAENRGAVTQAAGAVDLTQTQIVQTTLRAPFSGVVTSRLLDPGAYAGPSQPLFQVSQIDPIYIDFNVKDDDLPYVQPGTVVSFSSPALPNRRFQAPVVSLNVIPQTGTLLYRARLSLRNRDFSLRGGMLVTVRVTRALHRDVLLAPRSAVEQDDGSANVFLVAQASPAPAPSPSGSPAATYKARKIDVTLGLQNDQYIEVSSPNLHVGSLVVSSRPETLVNGSAVTPHS